MSINTAMSFDEVKKYMMTFIVERSSLTEAIVAEIPNFDTIIDILMGGISTALDTGNPGEQQLKNGDIERLVYLNYLLPSFYLSEQYDNTADFINAFIILEKNYIDIYGEALPKKCAVAMESLMMLMRVENNFSRLITLSQILLEKYQCMIKYSPESMYLSKEYLQTFLGEDAHV